MKKLIQALFIVFFPVLLFAQAACYENTRFSPFTSINDVIIDENNQLVYEAGSVGRCGNAFIVERTDTETNWIIFPAQAYELSTTTELWRSDGYIAAVGTFNEADDVSSSNDGHFFLLINTQTQEEELSILLNGENLGDQHNCAFFQNYYSPKPHLVKVSETAYWMSAYCGNLILVDPTLPEGFSIIDTLDSNITQMRLLTDALVAIATTDAVYVYNIETQQALADPVYTFQGFNTNVLMDATADGELFIVENQQLIKVYPEEGAAIDLPEEYTYKMLRHDRGDLLLLAKNEQHGVLFNYHIDTLQEVYTTAHAYRHIKGVRPLAEQFLFWGADAYHSLGWHFSNPFIRLQPKEGIICSDGNDIALVHLEVIDTTNTLSLNPELQFYTLETSIQLRATIVNKGADIQFFSVASSPSLTFNCYEEDRLLRTYQVDFVTGDTIIDDFILRKRTHYSYPDEDTHFNVEINFNTCLSLGTPGAKQDVFINDNSQCISVQTNTQFTITNTDDIVERVEEQDILLFPNPVFDELRLKTKGQSTLSYMAIYDLNGKLWHSSSIDRQYEYSMNCQAIPRGIYFIKIILSNGQNALKRVVLQ